MITRTFVSASMFLAVFGAALMAATGQCYALGPAAEAELATFKSDEEALLKSNPVGGIRLSRTVEELLLADPSLIDALLALARKGKNIQATAIGVGIGLAVKALWQTDRRAADAIAAKVAADGNKYVLTGYKIALNEAAMDGGAAWASPSSALPSSVLNYGVPLTGSNSAGGMGAFPYPPTYFSGVAAYVVSSGRYGGSTVFCSTSVSPYRAC